MPTASRSRAPVPAATLPPEALADPAGVPCSPLPRGLRGSRGRARRGARFQLARDRSVAPGATVGERCHLAGRRSTCLRAARPRCAPRPLRHPRRRLVAQSIARGASGRGDEDAGDGGRLELRSCHLFRRAPRRTERGPRSPRAARADPRRPAGSGVGGRHQGRPGARATARDRRATWTTTEPRATALPASASRRRSGLHATEAIASLSSSSERTFSTTSSRSSRTNRARGERAVNAHPRPRRRSSRRASASARETRRAGARSGAHSPACAAAAEGSSA